MLRHKKPKLAPKRTIDSKYIIPRTDHRISKIHISPNALKVLQRLHHAGFEAYLVGGCVRDLLLNKQPKDFDIATAATPNEIRRLFKNARIIGRRFKIVHVWFHQEIIEVTTFRGHEPTDTNQQTNAEGMLIRDNVYGSLTDDAWRRDISINAIYYAIEDGTLIDFTGGFQDIQHKTLRVIGEPRVRYQEDPVRMLRVIRFAAKLDLSIDPDTESPLPRLSHLILQVSNSRLFDEVTKLYHSGKAGAVQAYLVKYTLFQALFPKVYDLFDTEFPVQAIIELLLKNTDARLREDKPVTPAFLFAVLLWFPLQVKAKFLQEERSQDPIPALEQAMSLVIAEQCKVVSIPKRFTQVMREIWILQYRFPKRLGGRAEHLLTHPRFRAAYDLLALRALVNDAPMELVNWWTQFQEVEEEEKQLMISKLAPEKTKKRRKKRKKT